MTLNNNNIYATDLSFTPKVSSTGDISIVTNKDAINQSIYNIIFTPKGSRIGYPTFGAGIENFLFEPLTEDTANLIGTAITSQISLYEPRINVTSTKIDVFDSPQAGYQIYITYLILPTLTQGDYNLFISKQL